MSLVPEPSQSPPTALESLAQTLAIGNITGANDIVVSNPQGIDFAGDINIQNNTGGGGTNVVINTIPPNPGPPLTQGVFFEVATNRLYRQIQTNENLSQTLAIGNTTGASDIVVSNPQKIEFLGDVYLKGNGADVLIEGLPIAPGPTPIQYEVAYDPITFKLYYQPTILQQVPTIGYIALAANQQFPIGPGASADVNMIIASGSMINQINNGIPSLPNCIWLCDFSAYNIIWDKPYDLGNNDYISLAWDDGVNNVPLAPGPPFVQVFTQGPAPVYPAPIYKSGSIGPVPLSPNVLNAAGFLAGTTQLRMTNNSPTATLRGGTFNAFVPCTFYPNGFV